MAATVLLLPLALPGLLPCVAIELQVQAQWDLFAKYGLEGHVGTRIFADIDNDGQNEVIFNLGRSADFVALEFDGTEVWRSTQETTNSKEAYFPKASLEHGLLFYASRASNTLFAVNLQDGSLAWSQKVSTRDSVSTMSLELTDVGVLVGHDGSLGRTVLFDFAGNAQPGWPQLGVQHEQLLGAGDLDGDGRDDFLLNNNNGAFRVVSREGVELWSRTSQHTHLDYSMIADINHDGSNPLNIGAELLIAIDEDNSHSGEGDEIVLINELGQIVSRFATGAAGVSFAVSDIRPDLPGLEVFFGNEGSNTIGLLDHRLQPIFVSSLTKVAKDLGVSLNNAAGQTALADLDGDGTLELLINTGENASAGILVFSARGDFNDPDFDASDVLLDSIFGYGWDFDPQSIFPNGDPRAKRLVDVNGDGRDDILVSAVGANSATGDRTMYLLGNVETQPNMIAGDVNQDGLVTADDLQEFLLGWNTTGHGSLLARYKHGDFDLDGDTDIDDARVMHMALQQAASKLIVGGQIAQPVPEPSNVRMVALLIAAACALGRRPSPRARVALPTVGTEERA